jgi:Ca-activated chloride channel family protein
MKLRLVLMVFSLFGLSALSTANAGELSGIRKNNSGVKKFTDNKPVDAYSDFSAALGELPFSPEVHFNLGNAFLANKEFDKAVSEYHEAERMAKGTSARAVELRFRALFNTGTALAEKKKVSDALDVYQQALELKPESIEVKTNIELLTKDGGGGQGDSDKQDPSDGKDKKDGKGNDQKQPQPQDGQKEQGKPKPKPFKSEDLTDQDVGRILDELKRQEENIRAKMEHQNVKDAPPDKDW